MVLDNVSFTIPDGASVAIVGKSGSGKSSLVQAMSGLARPEFGEIIVNGHDILKLSEKQVDSFRAKAMGFVFQSFFVQNHQTCGQNISLPLEILGVAMEQRDAMINEALRAVGLLDKKDIKAINLSGGQKQRLAIARAIINRPRFLFADEPTGNLDSVTGQAIEELLFWCNKVNLSTLIMVTHDPDLAARCDMQIVISDGKVANIIENGRSMPAPQTIMTKQNFGQLVRQPPVQPLQVAQPVAPVAQPVAAIPAVPATQVPPAPVLAPVLASAPQLGAQPAPVNPTPQYVQTAPPVQSAQPVQQLQPAPQVVAQLAQPNVAPQAIAPAQPVQTAAPVPQPVLSTLPTPSVLPAPAAQPVAPVPQPTAQPVQPPAPAPTPQPKSAPGVKQPKIIQPLHDIAPATMSVRAVRSNLPLQPQPVVAASSQPAVGGPAT